MIINKNKTKKISTAHYVVAAVILSVFILEAFMIAHSGISYPFLWESRSGTVSHLWWLFNDFRLSPYIYFLIMLFAIFLQWYTEKNEQNGLQSHKIFLISAFGSLLPLLVAYFDPFRYAWDYILQVIALVVIFLIVQFSFLIRKTFSYITSTTLAALWLSLWILLELWRTTILY